MARILVGIETLIDAKGIVTTKGTYVDKPVNFNDIPYKEIIEIDTGKQCTCYSYFFSKGVNINTLITELELALGLKLHAVLPTDTVDGFVNLFSENVSSNKVVQIILYNFNELPKAEHKSNLRWTAEPANIRNLIKTVCDAHTVIA